MNTTKKDYYLFKTINQNLPVTSIKLKMPTSSEERGKNYVIRTAVIVYKIRIIEI